MEYYEAREGHSILFYLFWLVVAGLIFMILTPSPDTTVSFSLEHAQERHGQDADDVYNCYKDNGPLVSFWNAVTGRCAHVVKPDDQYGVVIESQDDPVVTAFKVGRDIAKVIGYLINRGYTIFAGP